MALFRVLLFEQPSRAPGQGFFYGFRMSNRGRDGPALRTFHRSRHGTVIGDKFQGRVVWLSMTKLGTPGGRGEKTLGQPSQKIYEKIHLETNWYRQGTSRDVCRSND